jgi:transcriptional regulator with XRE-family HTH domain
MKAEDYFRRRAAEDPGFREEMELASTAMNLARNAHRLRRALGWSQTRLAEEAGTSQPRIAEIEAGAGNPTLRTLTKLARALGTEVPELVGRGKESRTIDEARADTPPRASGSPWRQPRPIRSGC